MLRPDRLSRAGFSFAALALLVAAVPAMSDPAAQLRDDALSDDLALKIAEDLTTEVGPRLAGSTAEVRARDWAVRRLRALGFSNVRIETFTFPGWERGEERAEIISPFPQRLSLTTLGNSGSTGAGGLRAEVVGFDSVADLEAAADERVRGRIVFVSHAMRANQDGSGYAAFGPVRRQAPSIAARKGAAAIVIRSLGTDHHRNPHTGGQSWAAGVAPIPAAALSLPDAEQLQRMLKRADRLIMRLTLTPRPIPNAVSGNVIAEIPGRDSRMGLVLIGGHLDSWDLGTGAIDDAAGLGITTAAAKRLMDAGPPLRTVRLVWFGAEEAGLFGGTDYARRHRHESHAVIAESDSGADRAWRLDSRIGPAARPALERLMRLLSPLGIVAGPADAATGSDLAELVAAGVPVLQLQQDRTRYFDVHHTPDDTLDKIDVSQLRQNVAAWSAMLWVMANGPHPF